MIGKPGLHSWGGGTSPFTPEQEKALYSMFTNQEVGAILMGMAAMPTSAVTSQMVDAKSLSGFMKNLSPSARNAIFNNMGYHAIPAADYNNDTLWTNRLRVNLRAKATEDVEFKARLAMYKSWGMTNNPVD